MHATDEYQALFDACTLTSDPTRILELKRACRIILANELTYWGVEQSTGVPWFVVAAIHYRESSQSFKCHLHNGDPLTSRTVHVPSGRPIEPDPPYTWSQSAIDALSGRSHPFSWDIGGALEFCERYNGFGYHNRGVRTPYVWSYTDAYSSGLFVADGTIDATRKDPRPGIAAIFKTLIQGGVNLDFETGASPSDVVH